MNFKFDYVLIGLVLFVSIIGIVQIFRYREGLLSYKYGAYLIAGGASLILLSAIANSFFEHHWESEYILNFLILKRVSNDWFFRHTCSWGYIFGSYGIAMLVAVAINKRSIADKGLR